MIRSIAMSAAKTILNQACDWHEYLAYYDRQVERICRQYSQIRAMSGERIRNEDHIDDMNVFSSYEILYETLESSSKETCQDAVELLHIFSYHFQNIRLDTLVNAAINPLKEEQHAREEQRLEMELRQKLISPRAKQWMMFFRELIAYGYAKLDKPVHMPRILRNHECLGK
jgi:hypothetical protein